MTKRSGALVGAAAVVILTCAILLAMGRPPICTCGTVALWEPSAAGPRTSQMLGDWYSPSHVVHGILFYAMLWLVARRWPVERRLFIAVLVEAAWEIAENTPMVIDRYREATVALGYTGDSVLNSVSDLAMMALGFVAALKLPPWASVLLVLALEIVPLLVIRDNLTLNIWMLLSPTMRYGRGRQGSWRSLTASANQAECKDSLSRPSPRGRSALPPQFRLRRTRCSAVFTSTGSTRR